MMKQIHGETIHTGGFSYRNTEVGLFNFRKRDGHHETSILLIRDQARNILGDGMYGHRPINMRLSEKILKERG
jgi:hypothetical protein